MSEVDEGTRLGARFWFTIVGLCVAAVIGVSVFFIIFGHLWEALGLLGAFFALGVVLLAFGWFWDRRERKRRDGLAT